MIGLVLLGLSHSRENQGQNLPLVSDELQTIVIDARNGSYGNMYALWAIRTSLDHPGIKAEEVPLEYHLSRYEQ